MTKRALIRDYSTQIERLKSDLLATREKNGIFLSPEVPSCSSNLQSYESLMSENSGNRTHIEEVSKMLEEKQQEFTLIQTTFLEQTELLNSTSTKLDDAMTDLEEKRTELEDLISEIRELKVLLDQQVYITR
jgi:kinesin family protein 11